MCLSSSFYSFRLIELFNVFLPRVSLHSCLFPFAPFSKWFWDAVAIISNSCSRLLLLALCWFFAILRPFTLYASVDSIYFPLPHLFPAIISLHRAWFVSPPLLIPFLLIFSLVIEETENIVRKLVVNLQEICSISLFPFRGWSDVKLRLLSVSLAGQIVGSHLSLFSLSCISSYLTPAD